MDVMSPGPKDDRSQPPWHADLERQLDLEELVEWCGMAFVGLSACLLCVLIGVIALG